jgi:hypothetical protein
LTQCNEDTFILSRKVVDILSAHSNPYEAEAACGMALAVAACRVKQWPFRGRLESKPLPEGLQASHQLELAPEGDGDVPNRAAKILAHNLDAYNDNAITMFNLDGGPPPRLVGGRFVLSQDQAEPNLAHNELLFAVYAEGREFRMYTNGRTEGFQGPVGVSNRFPRLCSDLLQETQG